MRIHTPKTTEPDIDPDTVIDIERGAVTFDPWPFSYDEVEIRCLLLMEGGSVSRAHADRHLDRAWNTLAHTKAGTPVVAKELTWLELAADQ